MATSAEKPAPTGPASGARGRGRAHYSLRVPWLITGIGLIVLGVAAFLISQAYNGPYRSAVVGGNLPVNTGALNPLNIDSNNSPALTVNPLNPSNLVVANKIDSPSYSCALNVSFDGGAHWGQTPIPAPAGEEPKCYAPDASFGVDGTLYLSYVTLAGRANAPHAVWLASSRDGGQTLSAPIPTPLGKDSFMVRVVADPRVSGRVYLVWLKSAPILGLYSFGTTGNPIEVVRSDNGGRTWGTPVRVSSPSRARVIAPSPAFGPHGELYVLYLDLQGDDLDYAGGHSGRGGPAYAGQWQLVLSRSADHGASWSESTVGNVVPTRRFVVYTPPFPSLAVDQRDGRLYAAFEDGRNGDSDVELWTLAPGASGWSAPKRVNDTALHDGTAQYLPKLAVAPDGRLDVAYYDRRADSNNVLNQVSMQSSYDGGTEFTHHLTVSDRAFSSRIGFGGDRNLADLGGTLGLASTNTRAMSVWADTRAGTRLSLKQDIAREIVAFNHPTRISDGLKTVLIIASILLVVLGVAVIVLLGMREPARPVIVRP